MKKTLKYQVKKVDMEGVHFVITEQSHKGREFGKKTNVCYDNSSYVAVNGVELGSGMYPQFDKLFLSKYSKVRLYVRGSSTTMDNDIVIVPYEHVKDVFQAIEEYNNFDFPDATKDENLRKQKVIETFNQNMKKIDDINKELTTLFNDNPDMRNELNDMTIKECQKLFSRF